MELTGEDLDLIGRRFISDITIVGVTTAEDGTAVAVLEIYGERHTISIAELRQSIASGFLVEVGRES